MFYNKNETYYIKHGTELKKFGYIKETFDQSNTKLLYESNIRKNSNLIYDSNGILRAVLAVDDEGNMEIYNSVDKEGNFKIFDKEKWNLRLSHDGNINIRGNQFCFKNKCFNSKHIDNLEKIINDNKNLDIDDISILEETDVEYDEITGIISSIAECSHDNWNDYIKKIINRLSTSKKSTKIRVFI